MSCFYILEIKLLEFMSFSNIFSHSVGCLFTMFMVSFAVQNLVNLIRSYLFIFLIKKIIVAIPGLCCCDGFFLFVTSRATFELWCADFSLRWLLLLQSMGSRMCGLSGSSSWAPELSRWDLLGPGIDPVSPALAGGFFTTEPPYFCLYFYCLRRLT